MSIVMVGGGEYADCDCRECRVGLWRREGVAGLTWKVR